jgi:hypothetical protein
MLSPDHCLSRAERLRISLLVTADRIAARRLRTFVDKYRTLADLAVKNIDSPLAVPAGTQLRSISPRNSSLANRKHAA